MIGRVHNYVRNLPVRDGENLDVVGVQGVSEALTGHLRPNEDLVAGRGHREDVYAQCPCRFLVQLAEKAEDRVASVVVSHDDALRRLIMLGVRVK